MELTQEQKEQVTKLQQQGKKVYTFLKQNPATDSVEQVIISEDELTTEHKNILLNQLYGDYLQLTTEMQTLFRERMVAEHQDAMKLTKSEVLLERVQEMVKKVLPELVLDADNRKYIKEDLGYEFMMEGNTKKSDTGDSIHVIQLKKGNCIVDILGNHVSVIQATKGGLNTIYQNEVTSFQELCGLLINGDEEINTIQLSK